MPNLLVLNDENFEQEVVKYPGTALVDVYTDWCAPCKMLAPVIDDLAVKYAGKVKIGKLNAEQNQEISSRYNILSVPTVLFFKNGKLVDTQIGLASKDVLREKIDSLV